jgi:hypothetical protein
MVDKDRVAAFLPRDYKRLYRHEHLLWMVRLLMALMIVCLLICGWGFGFWR